MSARWDLGAVFGRRLGRGLRLHPDPRQPSTLSTLSFLSLNGPQSKRHSPMFKKGPAPSSVSAGPGILGPQSQQHTGLGDPRARGKQCEAFSVPRGEGGRVGPGAKRGPTALPGQIPGDQTTCIFSLCERQLPCKNHPFPVESPGNQKCPRGEGVAQW